LIRHAKSIVVLSGAGISTAAGIPDFRGPNGLYVTRRYDPAKVFEIGWFQRKPQFFYEFSHDFVGSVKDVRPTFSHYFLAELEQAGRLTGVITQNIDILHQLAGSHNVVELHGSYRSAACTSCRRHFEDLTYRWWEEVMTASPTPPVARCASCGGVLKPDIVFFGEPVNAYDRAEEMVAGCDLLLILGSSLQVSPASWLPYGTSATTIVVNRGPVMLPPHGHRFFVDADIDGYFREVGECLRMEQ
jgi:NAD-dependent deacetylase